MRRESRAFLWDAREAAALVSTFVSALTEHAYRDDPLRRSAVERQLEILGECLNNLRRVDPATAELIPDLSRIVGVRNILAHAYAVIDDGVVFEAATTRVPALATIIDDLLSRATREDEADR